MLIQCPECQRAISDSAGACPGCGHPMGASSALPARRKTPSLFGSFVLGGLGPVLRRFGVALLVLSAIGLLLEGAAALLLLVPAIGLIVGGAYASYVSRHSVRIRSKSGT